MTYYIPMEVAVRELEPRLYIAARLASEGKRIVTGEKLGVHRMVQRERGSFCYLDKGLAVENLSRYRQMVARGGRIVLLDEEGGVFPDGPVNEWLTLGRTSPSVMPLVSEICCWGQEQSATIRGHNPDYPSERVHVTGHPRFDMRKPEFARFYDHLAGELPVDGKFRVLVNTSYGIANSGNFKTLQDRLDYSCAAFSEVAPYEKLVEYYTRRYNHQKYLMGCLIEAVAVCAVACPEVEFIVRPHPAERMEPYVSAFEGYANVLVRCEGQVHHELRRASLLIHSDCTTAIEAYLMRLPMICFAPRIDPGVMQMLPVRISRRVADKEELAALIVQAASGAEPQTVSGNGEAELIRQRIWNIDERSIDRVVDVLLNPSDCPGPCAGLWKDRVRHHLRNAALAGRSLILGEKHASNHKFGIIEVQTIEATIEALRHVDPSVKELTVQRVQTNTFVLSPRC